MKYGNSLSGLFWKESHKALEMDEIEVFFPKI